MVLVMTTRSDSLVLARPERPPRTGALPLTRVLPAPELRLNGEVDSNSPALWDLVDGQPQLHVFTSVNGIAHRSQGPDLADLTRPSPQVVGLEPGDTDKTAGRVSRLFLHGTSSYLLEFQR
jgi:hypothetical protein